MASSRTAGHIAVLNGEQLSLDVGGAIERGLTLTHLG